MKSYLLQKPQVTTSGFQKKIGSPSLVLLLAGILIVVFSIGFAAVSYVEQILVRDTGEQLALIAAELARHLDRLLFERYGDIELMAKVVGAQHHTDAETDRYLNWMKSAYPVYLWLGATDQTGRIVAATKRSSIANDWSRSDWFKRSRDEKKVVVTDVEPFSELDGGMDAVGFTAPAFTSTNAFRGVVTARVSIHALEEVVTRAIHLPWNHASSLRNMEYQILDHRGNAFIDSDLSHKGFVNLYAMALPSALRSQSGETGYIEEAYLREGKAVITGYAHTQALYHFQGMNWSVLVRMRKDDVLSPIRTVVTRLSLAGLGVVLPLSVLLFWMQRRLHHKWGEAEVEKARAQQAEEALQHACVELERTVEERTADKQQLRSLSSQLRRNEQRIRQRLATELHDNIAQTLAFCNLKLQALIEKERDYNYSVTLKDVTAHLNEALTSTRAIMYDLRPFSLSTCDDFLTAVQWAAEKAQRHGLHVIIEDDGKPKALDEEVLTVLYQSIHEALFNVLKHAHTRRARISIRSRRRHVRVVVRDKGQGFRVSAIPLPNKDRCFGLFNIREQLNQINGELKIISVPGKGTTLIITVPAK